MHKQLTFSTQSLYSMNKAFNVAVSGKFCRMGNTLAGSRSRTYQMCAAVCLTISGVRRYGEPSTVENFHHFLGLSRGSFSSLVRVAYVNCSGRYKQLSP